MDLTMNLQNKEADFISACIKNEEWAQKMLYEEYYPKLYPVSIRYTKDSQEALDVLHDGFLKIFKNIGKYKEGTNLEAWLKRIVINTAIDHYRKKSRTRTSDIEDAHDVCTLEADAVSQMNANAILGAISELPDQYRTIFNLFIIEGFSHQEISDKLGINESTSRSNLAKARKRLKKILHEKQIVTNA